MELTFIGAFQVLVGVYLLLRGTVLKMFAFTMLCGLMGGSAALVLSSLGGSSIPPMQFALVFMAIRLLLPGSGEMARVADGLRANILLLCFVAYSLVAAYVGPRLFAGAIAVPPMKSNNFGNLYEVADLKASAQNITSSVYICGTLALALFAYVSCLRPGGNRTLFNTGMVIAFLHVVIGVLGVALKGTAADSLFEAFRNGSYAQLDQSYRGFIRINGIYPEASSYAAYAFIWFVFCFECWYRGVRSSVSGPAALALGLILIFSTSSSAYVALTVYSVIVVLRMVVVPTSVRMDRMVKLVIAVGLALIVACLVLLLDPVFASDFQKMILRMTIEKQNSFSGLQRAFWARKAFDCFVVSYGLGVGPGSFRSSSLFTAILGATGVMGMTLFLAYLAKMLKPLRQSTFSATGDKYIDTGVAASWAAFAALIPAAIASPSADPGADFALMAGAALALRRYAIRAPAEPNRVPVPSQADQFATGSFPSGQIMPLSPQLSYDARR